MPIGEICALAAAASWAIGSLLFARIGKRVAPGAMNLGKCVSAAVVLTLARTALTPWLGPVPWSTEAAVPLALSGIVGLTIGDTAYFGAIVALGVPRAILILASAPVFATLGGMAFLGEKVTPQEALGITLTLAGIALVVTGRPTPPHAPASAAASNAAAGVVPAAASNPAASRAAAGVVLAAGDAAAARKLRTRGILLGLVAALGQAAGSLLSRKAMKIGVDPLAAAAGRLLVGAAGLALAAAAVRKLTPWIRDLAHDRAWAKVSGAALIGTVGGIWLSQLALALTPSTGVATTLLATSPIFALPLAHATGHERITPRGITGTLLALAGVVLLSLRPS